MENEKENGRTTGRSGNVYTSGYKSIKMLIILVIVAFFCHVQILYIASDSQMPSRLRYSGNIIDFHLSFNYSTVGNTVLHVISNQLAGSYLGIGCN